MSNLDDLIGEHVRSVIGDAPSAPTVPVLHKRRRTIQRRRRAVGSVVALALLAGAVGIGQLSENNPSTVSTAEDGNEPTDDRSSGNSTVTKAASTSTPSTSQPVQSGPDDAPTSSVGPAPSVEESEVPVLETGVVYVAASATTSGIQLRHVDGGPDYHLPAGPTRLAFALDGPMVIYQSADVRAEGAPVDSSGPIRLVTSESNRALDFNTDLVSLYEAAMVDGIPMALVARTSQGVTGLVTTKLVAIDLSNNEQLELIVDASEDDAIGDARFSDGRIVIHRAPGTPNARVEFIDWDLNPIAEIPLSQDFEWTITDTSAIGPHLVAGMPVVARIYFDPRDGETLELPLQSILVEGVEIGAGFCGRAEEDFGVVSCNQADPALPPFSFDLELSIGWASTFSNGTVTNRKPHTRTIAPLGRCGKQNASGPGNVVPGGQFDYDEDGRFDFEVDLFELSGSIGILAIAPDGRYSEYLAVEELPWETIGNVTVELSEDYDGDGLLDLALSDSSLGTAYVSYNGCDLNQIGWIAN